MKFRLLLSQFFDLLIISALFLTININVSLKEINLFLFLIFICMYMVVYPFKNQKITFGQKILGLVIEDNKDVSLIKIILTNPILLLTLIMIFTNSMYITYFIFIINIFLTLLDISMIDIFYPKLKYKKIKVKLDFNYVFLFKYLMSNFLDVFIFAVPFLVIYFLQGKFLLITNNSVYAFNDASYFISFFLMLVIYYFYYPLSNGGSTLGMRLVNISIQKVKKNKLSIPFLKIGILNMSFWIYFLILINQLSININIIISFALLFISIFIMSCIIENNFKINTYQNKKHKKLNILVFIMLFIIIITSIKVTNNQEYYQVGEEYNEYLTSESFWNKKGVYSKEEMKKVKEELKTIDIASLEYLKNLIEDKDTTKIVENINLNKDISLNSKYEVDAIPYLKEFPNLKSLNININADKFDLKLKYGYKYTDEEKEEYSTKLKETIEKENKEFFDSLKSNNIKYEINIYFY